MATITGIVTAENKVEIYADGVLVDTVGPWHYPDGASKSVDWLVVAYQKQEDEKAGE